MKSGIELITEERLRQIRAEGWSAEHDDEHIGHELSYAAACYAIPQAGRNIYAGHRGQSNVFRVLWPFDAKWWKPTPENRIRELQKAGALIAAEIDRINRLDVNKILPFGFSFDYEPTLETLKKISDHLRRYPSYLVKIDKNGDIQHSPRETPIEENDIPAMLKQRVELAEQVVVMGKHLNDAVKLRSLTRQVRAAQKQYFKSRSQSDLTQSKQLEKQLDELLSTMTEDV